MKKSFIKGCLVAVVACTAFGGISNVVCATVEGGENQVAANPFTAEIRKISTPLSLDEQKTVEFALCDLLLCVSLDGNGIPKWEHVLEDLQERVKETTRLAEEATARSMEAWAAMPDKGNSLSEEALSKDPLAKEYNKCRLESIEAENNQKKAKYLLAVWQEAWEKTSQTRNLKRRFEKCFRYFAAKILFGNRGIDIGGEYAEANTPSTNYLRELISVLIRITGIDENLESGTGLDLLAFYNTIGADDEELSPEGTGPYKGLLSKFIAALLDGKDYKLPDGR